MQISLIYRATQNITNDADWTRDKRGLDLAYALSCIPKTLQQTTAVCMLTVSSRDFPWSKYSNPTLYYMTASVSVNKRIKKIVKSYVTP